MPNLCILNKKPSSFAFRAEKKLNELLSPGTQSSCQSKLQHTPDEMIAPQIKLFNLCMKLGHKAYFPFPSPPFTAPIHVSALCYREEKLCWRAELCGWLFSISMMCFTSTACSQILRQRAESKQSVFFHDALWVNCHYAANAISTVVLPPLLFLNK